MVNDKSDKSLPALFSDLMRETVDLIRKEMALARAEVGEKVGQAQSAIASIAIGAAVTLAGLFVLLQAVVNALAMFLPPNLAPWLAPLIIGVLVALVGYTMIKSGQSHLKADKLMPNRTMDSLRTDKAVMQEKVQ
jgi:predicted phage tail protein